MKPREIYSILNNIGANSLYHANTIQTCCTFLQEGGLLSRANVEARHLAQTNQPSDDIDKKYGIWDRIFFDHVDIHHRAGRAKGPNHYGPALFIFDSTVLLELPATTDILVTRQNPIHWKDSQIHADRFYLDVEELSQDLQFGDFNKMLVVKIQTGRLKFSDKKVAILLDNPMRKMASGQDAYTHAEKRLKDAASKNGLTISIQPHACRSTCTCIKKYAGYDQDHFDSRFA